MLWRRLTYLPLYRFLRSLTRMADEFGVAVVITNQVRLRSMLLQWCQCCSHCPSTDRPSWLLTSPVTLCVRCR